MKPKLLDFFCGAGGASMGYSRAGFDIVGVDNQPQPRYPFPYILGDAIEILDLLLAGNPLKTQGRGFYEWYGFDDFVAYHASPPCQGYMNALKMVNVSRKHADAPKLIEPIRDRLVATGKPFVIENVPGAPLKDFITLSGMMFNLRVIRKRWFECSGFEVGFLPCPQTFKNARAAGYIPYNKGETDRRNSLPQIWTLPRVSKAMGIDWMLLKELNQAIPPAYTEYIGKYLMQVLV